MAANSNRYTFTLRTLCHSHHDDVRAVTKKKISYIGCSFEIENEKKPTDSEKSRSDKSREIHRLRKKQKRQIKKTPTDSEKSRSDKSRRTHRLGKKQKQQFKKKTQIFKRGPTRDEISNLLSMIRNRKKINPFKKTRTKNLTSAALKQARVWLGRRSLFVFDNG